MLPEPARTAAAVDEEARLAALHHYQVLGSAPEAGYEDIAELASFICNTPMSLVSFVDRDRQWFKSGVGIGIAETPRAQSFCAHTIETSKTLIVRDARLDPRFSSNPLVLGAPEICFYAGAPIVEKNGHVMGTVCVLDTQPRVLEAKQISALEALARQVVVLLEQRRAIEEMEKAAEERRSAERMLQASEKRMQAFVNGLPVLAWIANADGWISWYNRRWYEYTGMTPEQMEGWGWQAVHDRTLLPVVMERWTASIRSGESFEMTFPLRGADGEFRPFLTRIEPLRDESGAITQWFGTNVEVDALQKTQLALERSQAGLNQVLTATTDAVMSVNRGWVLTYLNPRAEELYGGAEQRVGRKLWEVFAESADAATPLAEHCRRAMEDGVGSRFETEYGAPVSMTLGIEVYPSKEGIVMFSRDITTLKLATAAALQNEKLAAVGRLASTIAHEVNNPLEAVTNLLYLASKSADMDEAQPYLKSADLELRRASAITQQTLRFHRQSTSPIRVTFADLSRGILIGQHSRMRNSGVLAKERDRARGSVECLEGEIRQVLLNLVSNAIDAMNGRGGTLSIRGTDGCDWKTGRPGMVITVADTGTGMAESTRARVFEAFYTTKGIGGTGLGLWISKEIVERHQGVLRLRTSRRPAASGTVFRLFLPRAAVLPVAGIAG